MNIFVDFTHVSRRNSGIERVTKTLFSESRLAPLRITQVHASGAARWRILFAQWLTLPQIALINRPCMVVFPGHPPSFGFPLKKVKSIMYVHDVFLLTRRHDLNFAARYYMAPLFERAIKRTRAFLCNSEDTQRKLRDLVDADVSTQLFRPEVDNVFELSAEGREARATLPPVLKVVSVGTVEPRKNFVAGAKLCAALAEHLGRRVEYHIIGRKGWGEAWDTLSASKDCLLHGYLDDRHARQVIEDADVALCTSHEEGLGLPLLELQYAGIPILAPDSAIFREVLNSSGVFIDVEDPRSAAAHIASYLGQGWRHRFSALAQSNLVRWNTLAARDRVDVVAFLQRLSNAA